MAHRERTTESPISKLEGPYYKCPELLGLRRVEGEDGTGEGHGESKSW